MRAAALPVLVVGAVLRATPVRSLRVPPSPPSQSRAPYPTAAPSGEQEEPGDDFEVRPIPDEALRREKGTLSPVFQLGAAATRKLTFSESSDRLGSRILDVIGALSYAEKMNLGFAGVVARAASESHLANISLGMQSFFGFADASELYLNEVPQDTQKFSRLDDLNKKLEEGAIGHGVNVHVEHGEDMGTVNYQMRVSPTILGALKMSNAPITKMPLRYFNPRDLNVVVHVRRGDVSAHVPGRGTSQEYYFWLMNIMRNKMPDAKFHVFSETGRGSNMSEFNQYSEWGAIVHLDTEARETLAHMARADVLVTAHSSFSHAAALLNPNFVFHQTWMLPQQGWVSLPHKLDKLGVDEAKLEAVRRKYVEKLSQQIGRIPKGA